MKKIKTALLKHIMTSKEWNPDPFAFPLIAVNKKLRRALNGGSFQISASKYMAAVIEYLCDEIFFTTIKYMEKSKKMKNRKRISDCMLRQVLRMDEEFSVLLQNVTIPNTLKF